MAYEALYTRTRPQRLSQLVGQDHISLPLTRAINQNRLAHAYLLVGTRGTGKTSTARLMAKAVNCDAVQAAHAEDRALSSNDIPCGKCDACLNFDRSPDNVEFDAASNRSVEDISRLLSTVYLAPMQSRVKTFIIDEVHMLSFEAVNSILKLIEEPPDNVIFFLATTEYNKVPLTIRSRCQILNFKLIAQERIADYLTKVGAHLKLDIEKEAARKLARLAKGSMRDALTLLDQCYSMIDEKVLTLALVDETLGLVADSDLDGLIDAIRAKDRLKISVLNAKVLASGITAIDFAEEIITRARDLITKLDNAQSEEFYFYERMIELLRKSVVEMRASGIADIILETTLLKLASDAMFESVAVVRPSAQPSAPVEKSAPSEKPSAPPVEDEMKKMRAELEKDGDSSAKAPGERVMQFIKKYFGETKRVNVKSMLDLIKSAELEGDKLTLTVQTDFNKKSFDETYRATVEDAVNRLLERQIEIAVNSIEPPPDKKKNTASKIVHMKPKKRKQALEAQDLFGDVHIEDADQD